MLRGLAALCLGVESSGSGPSSPFLGEILLCLVAKYFYAK